MNMFKAVATSSAPEYRHVSELPPNALAQIHTHCPKASAEIEYFRTWLPGTGEEVFLETLIVRYPEYSPLFITTTNELQNLLRNLEMRDLPSTNYTLVHPDRAERHLLWMLITIALFCVSLFALDNFHERHPDTVRIQTVASHAPPSTPTPQLP